MKPPLDDRQLAALHPEFPALSRHALSLAHLVFTLTRGAKVEPTLYIVTAWGHNGTVAYHLRSDIAARVRDADPALAASIERIDLPLGCLAILLFASDGTWRTCGCAPNSMLVPTNAPGGES